ncbi:MAG: hypothetical protein FWE13_01535 [Firmicutes bacterium]|nr:hypothetical protein [Bacillota bacterium]
MKILVVYATKNGATKEIAERIAKQISSSEICDVKSAEIPNINDFDCVILGSAIYAGKSKEYANTIDDEKVEQLVNELQ